MWKSHQCPALGAAGAPDTKSLSRVCLHLGQALLCLIVSPGVQNVPVLVPAFTWADGQD